MVQVVTGWSPAGWQEYALRGVSTFFAHWPLDVSLVAYVETHVDDLRHGNRVVEQRLLDNLDDWQRFYERHRDNKFSRGQEQKPGFVWKAKCSARGYNFRFDALKFGRVPMIVRHAARTLRDGIMVWLDADTVTFAQVPDGFIETILPKKYAVAYLGRRGYHSECGFVAFRLPAAMPLIEDWAALYDSDLVFTLSEWHNSFAFDHVRMQHEKRGLVCHNMTPDGHRHCWLTSPLGVYIDHLKGGRKAHGFSPERMQQSRVVRPKPPEPQQAVSKPELRKA